jgi:hypothetical protein
MPQIKIIETKYKQKNKVYNVVYKVISNFYVYIRLDTITMKITPRLLSITEVCIIILLACVPLFIVFPYRVNIFLSWEGAYRLSHGQIPFRDFGIPFGGAFWIIPAIFFKIFGSQMISLVKAQVFINVIAGLSFRSILSSLSVRRNFRFLSVLLFCISYSFFNFWPWYNHTVIVYELIALAFLFRFLFASRDSYKYVWLIGSAVFVCLSVFTKQDGGGMAVLICIFLLGYSCFLNRSWRALVIYLVSVAITLSIFIIPFLHYGFGYWFNHGQPPHTARISSFEIIDELLTSSQWIKFYFFLIAFLLLVRYQKFKALYSDKSGSIFLLLTLTILAEAAIFQVTSYTPPDNNIFFHSFAFAYILSLIAEILPVSLDRPRFLALCTFGILFWWSGVYWKYIQRITDRVIPHHQETISSTGENVVNRKTYMISPDTSEVPMNKWVQSDLPVFHKILMPQPTVDGINRLMRMNLVKEHKNLKVLNMSELTPLATEIPYALESNPELPLWFHLGVGMFNRQAALYEKRIGDHYYDLILFEYIPSLNNFYPFRIRESLKTHYSCVDSFVAPRRGEARGTIEIYVKP